MSGRAPRGNASLNVTSTVTVPFCEAGSIRATCPLTMPLRVSISVICPMATSLTCVSGMRSSALSRVGSATRARLVPGPTRCPTSTGTCCSRRQSPPALSARRPDCVAASRCFDVDRHRLVSRRGGRPASFHYSSSALPRGVAESRAFPPSAWNVSPSAGRATLWPPGLRQLRPGFLPARGRLR